MDTKRQREDKKLKRSVWFDKLKDTLRCLVCGENHPACIQFHHRPDENKYKDVSVLVQRGYSQDLVIKEIQKCDVLCANCHRKWHWEREKNQSFTQQEKDARKKRYEYLSQNIVGRINIKQYRLIDQDGQEYITTSGLSQFCRDHGFGSNGIHGFSKAMKHNRKYKGWSIERIE